jgi:F-type H+-transporting ATPase subunit c
MKKVLSLCLALVAVALVASPALAQQPMSPEAAGAAGASSAASAKVWYFACIVFSSAFAMAIASAFCAMAQSRAITMALEGIARQPSVAGRIQTVMVIGLALIESLAIYVLLIALLLYFVKPFDQNVLGL